MLAIAKKNKCGVKNKQEKMAEKVTRIAAAGHAAMPAGMVNAWCRSPDRTTVVFGGK